MNSFVFIGDVLSIEGSMISIELIENYFLRKAVDDEIDNIKLRISSLGREDWLDYRFEATEECTLEGSSVFKKTDRKNWNYWIVSHNETQANLDLLDALSLCNKDINVLFQCIYNENAESFGFMLQHHKYYNFLEEIIGKNEIKLFTFSDRDEINRLFNLIKRYKSNSNQEYMYINKALDDFRHLKMIPKRTSFFYVGMFSIIESLLTHNSSNSDKGIVHQLATKLSLLNKRFEHPLELGKFFKSPASFENTIKKLYTYRSAIAHGDFADFKKELSALETKETASEFLYVLLKNVIIQSLKEPSLITDLKKV
jgi:hypothetical protein